MNERLGDLMTIVSGIGTAFYDMFLEDPDLAVEGAIKERAVHALFNAILAKLPDDVDWWYLLQIAQAMPKEAPDCLTRINSAANNDLGRKAMGEALVAYADGQNNNEASRFIALENAIANGVFDLAVGTIPKLRIQLVVRCARVKKAFVTAWTRQHVQHFLENGDPKRALDELIFSGTAIEGWRPESFDAWVKRVWYAHRAKGLVADMLDDCCDWRDCTMFRPLRFGVLQGRGGHGKTKQPKVICKNICVPLDKLWGLFTEGIDGDHDDQSPVSRASFGRAGWVSDIRTIKGVPRDVGRSVHLPVSRVGAMLRDMIWHWHHESSERKLRAFCEEHGLEVPTG